MTAAAPPVIVWFREDLRIADNPALHHAAASGAPVIPLFILDEESPGIRSLGAAQKWILHHGLKELAAGLRRLGAPLVVRKGPARKILDAELARTRARAVFWNRRYGKAEIALDAAIKESLAAGNIEVKSYQANLLHEPARLHTAGGGPFKVYSPFWRALSRQGDPRPPLPAPDHLVSPSGQPRDLSLDDLALLPTGPDWAAGLRETWRPGEAGAKRQLEGFLNAGIAGYADGRDLPGQPHASRLSPFLRWGMISPYQIWHATHHAEAPLRDVDAFRKELAWREFSYHLLFHFPDLQWKNVSARFDAFPWMEESPHLPAWRQGRTGYPLVDAGMRELWRTGYMHNRVRMVAASFLVKHLLVHWRVGERWFWDTLVDADPANNPASWQWVAGSGADAAPYFRIFNPVLQGRKFDPQGEYVRKWVPEIAGLPDKHLHAPWQAPRQVLADAGIVLGENYPRPVVDHGAARARALEAFASLRASE